MITFILSWNIPTLMEVVSSRMTMAPSILHEESPNGLMSINMMWILCNPAECPWEILAWRVRQRCLPPSIKAPNEGMSFMIVILVLPPLDFQELRNQSQTPLKYSGTHHLTHAVYSCFSFNLSSCVGLWKHLHVRKQSGPTWPACLLNQLFSVRGQHCLHVLIFFCFI